MLATTERSTREQYSAPKLGLREWLLEVTDGLESGALAPYLGPGSIGSGDAGPSTAEQLATDLAKKVALPKRVRGNVWSSAQYIESNRHRKTLVRHLADCFPLRPEPSTLHRRLASLKLPLIVDTWYDASMRTALAERSDWTEIQGISRAAIGEDRWYRAYSRSGSEIPVSECESSTTILYKPHGAVSPAENFLISDADYVEVLTEIDIQTPIPEVVRERRRSLGFVILGCRFYDQMLRIYARQIAGKRTKGPLYAVIDPRQRLTPNEQRFFHDHRVRTTLCPWEEAFQALAESGNG